MNVFLIVVPLIVSLISTIFSAYITSREYKYQKDNKNLVFKKSRLFYISNFLVWCLFLALALVATIYYVMGVSHPEQLEYYSQLATLLGVLVASLAALIALPSISKYLMDKGHEASVDEKQSLNVSTQEIIDALNKIIDENKPNK